MRNVIHSANLLAVLILLAAGIMVSTATSQEQVALTVYVHEGGLNGSLLSGVLVTGQDAEGNSFEGLTGSDGTVVLRGAPGSWSFSFEKEGHKTLNLTYDVSETEERAAYLQSLQSNSEAAGPVDLTVYVHDGSLNGTMLSGVLITGQDASGSSFEGTTDSDGVVNISGIPGTWTFTFAKEGYETLNLTYDVTETEERAAYLQRSA